MFPGASDAVGAAVAIQQAAYAHNREVPDEPLDIRIGLSAGDVSVEDGDCFGTPVVEASRLCAVALGAQILAADLVRLLARGRGGHVFTAAGERELKGLPEPISVVTVGWEPPEPAAAGISFPGAARAAGRLALLGPGRSSIPSPGMEGDVHGGERRVVLVSGEPGIGKTRLAAEVGSPDSRSRWRSCSSVAATRTWAWPSNPLSRPSSKSWRPDPAWNPWVVTRGARSPRPRPRRCGARARSAAAIGPRDRALPPLRRRGRLAGGDVVAGRRVARARRPALGREADPAAAAPPRALAPDRCGSS